MKTLTKKVQLSSVLALLTVSVLTWAQDAASPYYAHATLKQKITTFLNQQIKARHAGRFVLRVGAIDYRLRLKRCSQPLNLFLTQQVNRNRALTVGVRCEGSTPWLIYVPSQVMLYKNVLVAKTLIKRGAPIHADDVTAVEREITRLYYAYYESPKQVAGKLASRTIMPGTVMRPNLISEPKLVKRGELVTILAEVGGIKVKMNGRALTSAGRGRMVKVKNLSSNRIIEGIVIGKGIVKVRL